MKFTVQFTRYFEEFGFEDCDTKEFNSLKEAYDFYNEKKDDENLQLWEGTIGDKHFVRIH